MMMNGCGRMSKMMPIILSAALAGKGGGTPSGDIKAIKDLGFIEDYSQSNPIKLNDLKKGIYCINFTSKVTVTSLYFNTVYQGENNTHSISLGTTGTSYPNTRPIYIKVKEQLTDNLQANTVFLEISSIKWNPSYDRLEIVNDNYIMNSSTKRLSSSGSQSSRIEPVLKSGNQTVSGVKTFNSLPKSSATVSNDDELTNKKYVDDKISEVELFKFPNMTIFGEPTVQQGQVSNFSDLNYMEFPFLVDFRGRSFEINFAFTTGTDIDNQQNILDSEYGLAFAIKNKHFLIALSINGTSWATAQSGTFTLSTETTYRVKITWDGLSYKVSYSIDGGQTYIDDITFGQSIGPYPKQMYIGVSKLSDNYFKGSINLNYANLKISDEIVWTGMDDVGLATRLATDLSNIDNAGITKIEDIVNAMPIVELDDTKYDTFINGGAQFVTSAFKNKFNTLFTNYKQKHKDGTYGIRNGNLAFVLKLKSETYNQAAICTQCSYSKSTSGTTYFTLILPTGSYDAEQNWLIIGTFYIEGTWTNDVFNCTNSYIALDPRDLILPKNIATKTDIEEAIGGALGGSY